MAISIWPDISLRKRHIEVLIALFKCQPSKLQSLRPENFIMKRPRGSSRVRTHRFMEQPVVNLELNPGGGEQVQGRGRDKAIRFSRHEPIADQTRIRGPQLFVSRLLSELPGKVATEAHSGASHERHLQRVVLPIRVSCAQKARVLQRFFDWISLCGSTHVRIIEILGPELSTHKREVKGAENGRQFVPWNVFVDESEYRDTYAVKEGRLV